ncbi:WbqC family protein [Compostibacter hankyongensis]|uniref:WbqC family protein n=1 Tax=Compostibacter hankyongensis TaxID=1007089 RepID=A0ABP8G1J0_9BACT
MIEKKSLLIDSQLFPCIYYYLTLLNHDKLKIEQYDHYQKLSYRNRYYIAGPNGRILLSVPLEKGKNQRTAMKDVRICNRERWQSLHWKTLTSAYRRSPWFEFFEDELRPCFEQSFDLLIEFNSFTFNVINRLLGFSVEIDFTGEYHPSYTASGVADHREKVLPRSIFPALEGSGAPAYTQVFGERTGFLSNLSILDLLFCEGKRAMEWLEANKVLYLKSL